MTTISHEKIDRSQETILKESKRIFKELFLGDVNISIDDSKEIKEDSQTVSPRYDKITNKIIYPKCFPFISKLVCISQIYSICFKVSIEKSFEEIVKTIYRENKKEYYQLLSESITGRFAFTEEWFSHVKTICSYIPTVLFELNIIFSEEKVILCSIIHPKLCELACSYIDITPREGNSFNPTSAPSNMRVSLIYGNISEKTLLDGNRDYVLSKIINISKSNVLS